MLIMKSLGEKWNVLTMRVCFGKYFHYLISHTPDQSRTVSGRAAKATTQITSICQLDCQMGAMLSTELESAHD